MAEQEPYKSETSTQAGDESIREWAEWLDHQYDPGYYTGGRMPPFYRRSRRPSYFGYALVATGSLFLIVILLGGPPEGAASRLQFGVGAGIFVLQILAGLRLARGAPERKHRRDSGKRR